MNGRVYDPLLGRFLSPDNIVQAPGNSQSYNRYSYCLNNPFKYTDPSGYSLLSKIGDGITNALNWLADEEDRFASWQYKNHISGSANFSYDINLGGQSTVSVSVIPGETGSSSSSTAFTPSYRDYPDVNFDPGAQHFDSNSGLYSFNGGLSVTSSQSSPSIGFSGNSESPWGTDDPESVGQGGEAGNTGVRAPDFYSLNITFAIPNPLTATFVGWSGNISIDRHGQVFISPYGVSVGKSAFIASASLTANWMLQSKTPTANESYNFLSGHGISIGGGYIGGANWTISPANSGTENALGTGLYTPQVGASYNYTPEYLIFNKK